MDVSGVTILGIVAIMLLLLLSAFFSSTETALFTLPNEWLDEQAASSDHRLATLRDLLADPHRLLVTLLVGNNIVNVAIASTTTALLLDYLPTGSAVTIATLVASFVVLIFGEIVPKSYGLGHATTWAPRVAGTVAIVERVLYPLVVVFDHVTHRLNERLGGEVRIEQPYVNE